MAISLRITPEIWKLTLLTGLGGLGAMTACSGKAEDTTGSSSNTNTANNHAGTTATAGSSNAQGVGGSSAGGAGAGGATALAGNGAGAAVGVTECEGEVGVSADFRCLGASTPFEAVPGLQQCQNGVVHRPAAVDCDDPLPREVSGTAVVPLDPDAGAVIQCNRDEDCTDAPHGYCEATPGGGVEFVVGSFCNYGCITDSECGEGMICECGSPVGHCVLAQCKTDADCACDSTCMRVEWNDGCGPTSQYLCQSPDDACIAHDDCGTDTNPMLCEVDGTHTACFNGPSCAIGRPFLVQGRERTASTAARSDWCAPAAGSVALREPANRALADYWQAVGLMEHASIAAFARFTLELMGQGAPPTLVEASTKAMADETAHARIAFTLASRYRGEAVGPGPLGLQGAAPAVSLASMVQTAIIEGAVGETVAAMEAAEALCRATDPEVRSALDRIAQDETTHARLAWDFLAWALQQDPGLKALVEATFAAALREPPRVAVVEEHSDPALEHHGLLTASLRQEVRHSALREVIGPCAQALLGPTQLLARSAA